MYRMIKYETSSYPWVRANDLGQIASQTMTCKAHFEAEGRHMQNLNDSETTAPEKPQTMMYKTQFEAEKHHRQKLNDSETYTPREAWFLFHLRRSRKNAIQGHKASSSLTPSIPAKPFPMELSLNFTVADIQELIGFCTPDIAKHESIRTGLESTFCRVSAHAKHQILQNFPEISEMNFKAYGPAKKDLSPRTMYPYLGFKEAKPLIEWSEKAPLYLPRQDQYPVYYFLYSPLNDPECLSEILDLEEEPQYYPARITGGELTRCHSVYQELIDWAGGEEIGVTYQVRSREDELKLLHFQTDKFEVVRTMIQMEKDSETNFVPGLTFRYIQDFLGGEVGL